MPRQTKTSGFENVLLKSMINPAPGLPAPIMVMGVSACGKSEIASRLAASLGLPFIEGDALHPLSNIEKMSNGEPLEDDDRWPWLAALADEVAKLTSEHGGAVFSCSALKQAYRLRLRERLPDMITVFLDLDFETAKNRASGRAGHFMPAALVESQFATLESPLGEKETIGVNARQPIEDVMEQVLLAVSTNAK